MVADAGISGLTMGHMITSLLNMVENKVNYAKAKGIIPIEHPDVSNPFTEPGTKTKTYSDYLLFVALYLLETEGIKEESFQNNLNSLPFYVFMCGAEFIEKKEYGKDNK